MWNVGHEVIASPFVLLKCVKKLDEAEVEALLETFPDGSEALTCYANSAKEMSKLMNSCDFLQLDKMIGSPEFQNVK